MKRRTFLWSALAAAGCSEELPPVTSCDPLGRGGEPSAATLLTPSDFDSASECGMTEEEQLGPYYLCVRDFRASIAEDRPGLALRVGLRVVDERCAPITGAVVDLWHCDAGGHYSGFDADPDLEAGSAAVEQTATRFCRGAQVTNDAGIVEFQSIVPGWYAGRTTHLHVHAYLPDGRVFTTQTYFEESLRDSTYAMPPYDEPRSAPYPTNAHEGVPPSKIMRVNEDDTGLLGTMVLVT